MQLSNASELEMVVRVWKGLQQRHKKGNETNCGAAKAKSNGPPTARSIGCERGSLAWQASSRQYGRYPQLQPERFFFFFFFDSQDCALQPVSLPPNHPPRRPPPHLSGRHTSSYERQKTDMAVRESASV